MAKIVSLRTNAQLAYFINREQRVMRYFKNHQTGAKHRQHWNAVTTTQRMGFSFNLS